MQINLQFVKDGNTQIEGLKQVLQQLKVYDEMTRTYENAFKAADEARVALAKAEDRLQKVRLVGCFVVCVCVCVCVCFCCRAVVGMLLLLSSSSSSSS